MAPQRERFDTAGVHRAQDRCARRHSESNPTRTISAEGLPQPRQICHSESASTRRISAEGSPRSRQIRTAPQQERFDRGFARPRQIRAVPQRERFERTISQRVRRAQDKFARRHSEGHARSSQTPQQERFDTHDSAEGLPRLRHDLRRGFAKVKDKFARRHSQSASTRTISAEGPRSRQICTAPQRERFDTHDLRRGFIGLKTNSHGATARALRHARFAQRGAFRKLPSGLPPP